jgi:sugar/nucleoside kinase (ribokinase family)
MQKYYNKIKSAIFGHKFFKEDYMSLLSIGTVAFDNIETPYGKVERVIGGACTYISIAASYFTNDLMISSIVGGDFPKRELKYLEGRGINLEGLEIKKEGKSFFWGGKYHDNMNKRDTIFTELNVLDDFDPVLPESYKKAKYLMLGNLTPDIQMQVINQMKKKPKLITLDTMNFWMDIAMPSLKKVLKKVDVLTINDEEARQLSGEYSLVKAAKKIFKMGPTYLIIKKGEHGAMVFYKDKIFFAPALPLTLVKDPTGAGDTFAGGFMGYLASVDKVNFETIKTATIYGSVMASFCVEDFSIKRLKKITKADIKKRVKEFEKMVKFKI